MSLHKPASPAIARVSATRLPHGGVEDDALAVEEPLEIRLCGPDDGEDSEPVAITMRTPGEEVALAVGFLHGEGLLRDRADLLDARRVITAEDDAGAGNRVEVRLAGDIRPALERLRRHFYTSSSCGLCGRRSLQAVHCDRVHDPADSAFAIALAPLLALPETLRSRQRVFEQTGSLHAAASFDSEGRLERLSEDVGRHNAVDKLIGAALLAGELPLAERGILVSGRASFELVQKAAMAGCPMLAAVGGPSSLAVELARDSGMALVGFLREGRCNVYAGAERIRS